MPIPTGIINNQPTNKNTRATTQTIKKIESPDNNKSTKEKGYYSTLQIILRIHRSKPIFN